MFLLIIIFLSLLWVASGVTYYKVTGAKNRAKLGFRLLIALWSFWLEFAYVRVENGKTTYKNSLRKWWSHASHAAFHIAWAVKILHPIWATPQTVALWQSVAASIDSVLILGLASHSVALATAYHYGKKQEIDQVTSAHGDPGER